MSALYQTKCFVRMLSSQLTEITVNRQIMPLVYFIITGQTQPAIKTKFFSTGGEHLKTKEKIQVFPVTFYSRQVAKLLICYTYNYTGQASPYKTVLDQRGQYYSQVKPYKLVSVFVLLNPSIPPKQLKKTFSLALPSMGEGPPLESFCSSSSGKKEQNYRYMYLIGVSE